MCVKECVHTCVGDENREKLWEDIGGNRYRGKEMGNMEKTGMGDGWALGREGNRNRGEGRDRRKDGDGERIEGDRLGTEMCICLHLCERETHTDYVCVCVSGD